ncbi:BCCT family transporter [Nocardia cyriacigeorgica]|uniref:BCCT family transporter n=1 Tax=Nocardia cyriacigeorgica TaxID=135487 RepID=UPI0013D2539B|nr:BCCT family transporter [Nocardia cyriacigeorgica]MBF6435463.1 BCCT family transporter [Nocardia cyriacigeorgica]MBF6454458.1 BCCT family transporter [Nocardia cyriacigeorgica]MBF6480284.1 BCCT family transporter [Nocardia cyriacigeorgica]MBF6552352.1 BCCT family transporter [Nocardia cyriacigeorgica]NEW25991.1 BCCT family transporter [Nocardia cyriacigeorgica]
MSIGADRNSRDTEATVHRVAGRSPAKPGLDRLVFGVTAIGSLAFVAWGIIDRTSLATAAGNAQTWVISNTGWLFVLIATVFVVYVIWLAASRYGKIPLGADGEKPEFRTVSWIAMMFSAGMGIGLMFWGVAEPLSHFVSPPPGTAEPGSPEAAEIAMATTLFHWTLHPWAIYAVAGLAIAYSTFRRGRSQLISSVFRPILGRRADGIGGQAINMMAIFATLFGSAASLGLGALQIGAGMEFNGWIDAIGKVGLVAIICGLTIAFIFSAVSGIDRGIQWLSNINMVLALAVAAFVFIAGPTLVMLNFLPAAIGDYIAMLPTMASRTGVAGGEAMETWLSSWTIFYWAWWISWTPFVGMFIARISRGRTIRQFVTGVLLVPSVVSLIWFVIFGGAGIQQQSQTNDLTEADGSVNENFALFHLLDHYPLASFTAGLVMVLVAIFFVSGADAASIVMGTLSEKGSIEPSRPTVIFWGSATGAVAAIMLVIADPANLGGALTGLQALTTVVSLPFMVVMGFMCVSLYRDLRADPIIQREDLGVQLVVDAVVQGTERHDGEFELVTEAVVAEEPDDSPEDRTAS